MANARTRTRVWQRSVVRHAPLGLIAILFVLLVGFDYTPRFGELEHRESFAYSGDEPHYILTINSLLEDGDLELRDDYDAAYRGSFHAGEHFAQRRLEHHTILVDRPSGRSALWERSFDGEVYTRCNSPGCVPYSLRDDVTWGDDPSLSETPAHPPAFAALLATIIAPWATPAVDVERYAARVLVTISFAGVAMTYAAAFISAGSMAATIAVSLLVLASPWTAYAKGYFPETTVGLLFAWGLWAMLRHRPAQAAFAVAVAMFIKPHFVLAGGAWILERWWAGDRKRAVRMAIVLGACGVALIGFNASVLGRVVVAGSAGWVGTNTSSDSWLPLLWLRDAGRNLLDPNHGLLRFVPWAPVSIVACIVAFRWPQKLTDRRDTATDVRRLLVLVGPTLGLNFALLVAYGGGLGGVCFGPRYWIAYLPWLAIAAAVFFSRYLARRRGLVLGVLLFLLAASLSVPAALQYSQVWHRPASTALVRMLPRLDPPVGTIVYSPLEPKAFRQQNGRAWVMADGRVLRDSSLYSLVTGHRRRPRLLKDAQGRVPYVRID